MILPLPQSADDAERVALPRDVLRVAAGGMDVRAVADLVSRAFGIRLIADEDAPHVVLERGAVTAPTPVGAEPRPMPAAAEPEAYEIRVAGERLVVTGAGDEAFFRALVTVATLTAHGRPVPRIGDHPRFSWRGLSLDIVRRWYPVEEIRRIVDLLALHKLNVLHLHLTDSQAWRFAVPGYDALTPCDAHLTGEELSGLVAYARERHVTVVPELDLPGHVAETVSAAGVDVVTGPHPVLRYVEWGAEGVADLVRAALAELASRCDSPYLHIGGDEAFGDPHESYNAFVVEAVAAVRALGRRVVGWQETSRSGALTPQDLGQLWIAERDRFDPVKARDEMPEAYHPFIPLLAETFAESVGDAVRLGAAGIPTIVSSSDPLYLDRKPVESSVDPAQTKLLERLGFPNYERTSSTDVLRWEPTAQDDIVAAGIRVAGVEAALWAETITSLDDAATLLLPRLAFVAQRAWGAERVDEAVATAAARAYSDAWTRLGFGSFYRSAEVFS
ncbi:MAG: hypothetical protein BGN97_05185 [Microbacterium sp. 69-10]|uniref:family 20 glycosylhydrolase n=1 Tax=Microbacterium sp. 69-10 TaxID=1895783 RepID=UPI0009624CE3|nr:family 20 glycosylhydrolase [Microbacterium sp. 69-10]OJU40706.1 MAG: hypothetical protein BGN97_05185 [Microbacterium sp. 69-10]